jgi:hypothetical protein
MGTASPDRKTLSSAFIATSAQPERPVAKRTAKAGVQKASATESTSEDLEINTAATFNEFRQTFIARRSIM